MSKKTYFISAINYSGVNFIIIIKEFQYKINTVECNILNTECDSFFVVEIVMTKF